MTDFETIPDELPPRRRSRFAADGRSNLEAKFEAQKLAFGPLMFQAARVLRDSGALRCVKSAGRAGVTAEEVAEQVESLSIYAARVLLEAGYAGGMLALEGERYSLTKVGFLVLTDPMTRVHFDFVHDVCYRAFYHFDAAIREGRPVGLAELGPWPTIYEGLTELPEQVQRSWFAFDHYYSDGVFGQLLPIVFDPPPRTLLDVGGNTGKWAVRCCAHDPEVKVTIVDHPGQLARALQHAMDHGCGDRVSGQALDLLDGDAALPRGYDVVWLSQFLDCFSEAEIIGILRRGREALAEGGRLYILETYWDRQQYEAARYSVINTSLYFAGVANGNSKMYHSDRMKHCVEAAGLRIVEERDRIGLSHTLFRCE